MTLMELVILILYATPAVLWLLLLLAKWHESFLWDEIEKEAKESHDDPQS